MGTLGNRLSEAVLMSNHNLCFGAKIRKLGKLLHSPVLLYKWGLRGYTFHGYVFMMSKIHFMGLEDNSMTWRLFVRVMDCA